MAPGLEWSAGDRGWEVRAGTACTFDGLRLEEILYHDLNLVVMYSMGQRLRDVLQYHSALQVRKAFPQGNALMAQTSAHVDEEGLLWARASSHLLHRVHI